MSKILITSEHHALMPKPPDTAALTDVQLQAAHALDAHVSVTAAPGAGKTSVLIERFLHILRTKDISIDQIVAITFTKRAANEMRERLRKRVNNGVDAVSEPAARARWIGHKRTLDGAVITTIHGFCSRLLREFPLEAKLDPQFSILDEHESALLLETVVEQSLTELIDAGDEAITRLMGAFGRENMIDGLGEIYRQIKNKGLLLDEVERCTRATHATIYNYEECFNKLDSMVDEFLELPKLSSGAQQKQEACRQAWPSLRKTICTTPALAELGEYCQLIENFRTHRPRKTGKLEEIVRELDELIWEKELGGRLPQICFDLTAREYATDILNVIRRIDARLDREKQKMATLDYDDLQIKLLRMLTDHPEVARQISNRYQYFLIDEFQDTNDLQRDIMTKLALEPSSKVNLFIVGDRKQSIYGFRGADTDTFYQMSMVLEKAGGKAAMLNQNHRSQPALIAFFNYLFKQLFKSEDDVSDEEKHQLGFVAHEAQEPREYSVVERPTVEPIVELLIASHQDQTLLDETIKVEWIARERDAEQIVSRLREMSGDKSFKYGDVAVLFQSLNDSSPYEAALRRAGIPYQIVKGKGFYQRPEITDLIQLLRFLDNTTDELALAGVLRSPLCGISDNALLALTCAPAKASGEKFLSISDRRPLFQALINYDLIDFIDDTEHDLLEQAKEFLLLLIEKRNRYTIAELLRFAVDHTEFRQVIVTNFDGPQRLANIEKLFRLAEKFEETDLLLISNFIRFVKDFEKVSGRESEGEIDDALDALKLMTIHQAKGLEFPVVIVADLQRKQKNYADWYVFDRHLGLTLKIPDGRGSKLKGYSFDRLVEREKLRSRYEKMRLLYVAATRARDRLIFTGAVKKDLSKLENTWLGQICDALEIEDDLFASEIDSVLQPSAEVKVRLKFSYQEEQFEDHALTDSVPASLKLDEAAFPFLPSLEPVTEGSAHRFSVTQLLNFHRCPRQYFYTLGVTIDETVKEINSAEAAGSTFGLTATQTGTVIHKFCDLYTPESDLTEVLRLCLEQTLKQSGMIFTKRFGKPNFNNAFKSLLPLARKYVESDLLQRVLTARAAGMEQTSNHRLAVGVYSEQPFFLRRPRGIISGSIDKLLVFPQKLPPKSDQMVAVEIIDFKTNRFRAQEGLSLEEQIQFLSRQYLLQMQAYALAVYELVPNVGSIRLTLHFLEPGIEVNLNGEKNTEAITGVDECAREIDAILEDMILASSTANFPAQPGSHCRMCNFLGICQTGRKHVASCDEKFSVLSTL